jgi:hypothetical protein
VPFGEDLGRGCDNEGESSGGGGSCEDEKRGRCLRSR